MSRSPKGHCTSSIIEHSENKIITYSENEAGLGVFEFSAQQTCYSPEFLISRVQSKHSE